VAYPSGLLMKSFQLPFATLSEIVLQDLSSGKSVAISGLSNTGKSTFMRGLSSAEAESRYEKISGQQSSIVYIDCNRAVAISARAFYEVVLRSLLEGLKGIITDEVANVLSDHHLAVTESTTAFSASLSFNLALTELCEQMDRNLCLVLDEFDEIYSSLDDRALLNLRALQDRFRDRLTFVTATIRKLPAIRGKVIEGEFAELFSHSSYQMHALSEDEAKAILRSLELPLLSSERRSTCIEMAGAHPGLLISVAQIIGRLPKEWKGDFLKEALHEPQPRAECLKIWEQLAPEEHEAIISLATKADEGLSPQHRINLEKLGLVAEGHIFSMLFETFAARRGRGSEIDPQGVFLDADSGDVWVNGVRIPVLTDLEFRLLSLLFDRRDKISDKYRIVTAVWGESYLGEVDDARVEKLVSRLRSKIEPDPSNPMYLITQRGRGYKLLSKPRNI
jgi:DNA-binding winged helix-turn-helix (wHTH) protein